MPRTFSPPTRVSDPDMHHDTYVTHVPWCMPGSLTSGFLWNRWRRKRSGQSRRMDNPQFYVSGKRPMFNDSLISWLPATVDGVWVVVTSEHWGMSQYSYLSESASVAQAGSLVLEDEDAKMATFRQKLFASTTVSSGSCPSGQFSNIDKIAHHTRHGRPLLDTLWLPEYEVPVVSSKQFGPGTERWNHLDVQFSTNETNLIRSWNLRAVYISPKPPYYIRCVRFSSWARSWPYSVNVEYHITMYNVVKRVDRGVLIFTQFRCIIDTVETQRYRPWFKDSGQTPISVRNSH